MGILEKIGDWFRGLFGRQKFVFRLKLNTGEMVSAKVITIGNPKTADLAEVERECVRLAKGRLGMNESISEIRFVGIENY